ncbi:MAG: C1 family peptidase [Planctomycetaceae bacterium]|nr:C1 family peptidase [Planctomycetaceae bacterium]
MAIAPTPETTTDNRLTDEYIAQLREDFDSHPTAQLMQNAVTRNGIDLISRNHSVVAATDHSFSNLLDSWKVTNQKQSGRCWLFAGLNLFRPAAMNTLNLKEFEFSQNYTLFWDKFERANYFLEAMIETAGREIDDRTVAFLLECPLDDGGQWNMFVNIIRKHGIVPKYAMPETQSSSATRKMNEQLLARLRKGALEVRSCLEADNVSEQVQATKKNILEEVYRMLSIHLGTPPTEFDWQWNDKDKVFHNDGEMTPLEFANRYFQTDPQDYVCLVNDPRKTSSYNNTYTVEFLGNVVGGDIVKYLNVDVQTMKQLTMATLLDGEPVWMGCDVGKMMDRNEGVWDVDLFKYEDVYDAKLTLTKAERLLYHETLMTHAMLFTGVDVIDDENGQRARRWRVENSWGDENGKKGFYTMNDSWFDEFMFEVAIHKKYLSEELLAAWDLEPIPLRPWDPMGALARRS